MSKRVLVIDDSPMTVELISGALAAAGFVTETARDLASLDERLMGAPFDLVLVDVNMPEMYGDDVVEFLRVQRKLTAKLLLYSDISEKELEAKAKAVGADGFITKSAGLEAAVETIRAATDSGEAEPVSRRVLVVEKTPAVAKSLGESVLGPSGSVVSATSSGEATRALLNKKTRPDLVVIDVRTPGVDASELCKTLKSNAIFQGIQVVLVGNAGDALTALQASVGADLAVPADGNVEHALSTLLGGGR
jgi:CheY-like chemotaxis protein